MQSADHARNFVFKVALNLARSHLRRAKRVRVGDVPEVSGASWEATVEDRMLLDAALASLSPRQRAVVVLIDYQGFDAPAAAAVLGLRASTVRVHLARARAALGSELGSTVEERT
jgi:RNA polymerase sigma factor (sigma-70 family)